MLKTGSRIRKTEFCGLFMLALLPLLFNDAYFDINRFKVQAALVCVPVAVLFTLIAHGFNQRNLLSVGRPAHLFAAVFLLACWISCAGTGFEPATLTGSEGRACGTLFLTACVTAFFCISLYTSRTDMIAFCACTSAVLVSFLGILNVLGIDPLGFYARIQSGQRSVFLSTIGNVDFYGAYLAMILPIALGYSVFSKKLHFRWLGFASSLVLMLGVCVSQTDIPFLSMQVAFLSLIVLSSGDWACLRRIFLLWGMLWFCVAASQGILSLSMCVMSGCGIADELAGSGLDMLFGAFSILLGIGCWFADLKRIGVPGRKRTATIFVILGFVCMCLLFLGSYMATNCFSKEETVGLWKLLCFDDTWGSRRGFAYRISIRAFSDFTWMQKLFGKGVDLALRILMPYFDSPDMLTYGVFNDAHCQPLQYLLTCGLFGFSTFLGIYASIVISTAKHVGNDPLLCGLFAFLLGYSVIMLFSASQPILIATYFSLCALALARIRIFRKGGSQ